MNKNTMFLVRKILFFFLFFSIIDHTNAQTTISAGSVSGTWTKSGSPYKVNGDITVPDGQTLTIEAGVKIEFAQSKWMKVFGRIIAVGKSTSTDSIWFTKQNPHDTGWWKGVKFIKPDPKNDTSIFSYCVFRNARNIYDTARHFLSGAICIATWGKVKFSYCTFYKNEATKGSSILITQKGYASINSCNFKYNYGSMFWYKNGVNWSSKSAPTGSALSIEIGSSCQIDSCIFYRNKIGKSYFNSSFIDDAPVVYISGTTISGYLTQVKMTNCIFDDNEGISIQTWASSKVDLIKCVFKNGGTKTYNIIEVGELSKITTKSCIITQNQGRTLISNTKGEIINYDIIISNNSNISGIMSKDNNSSYSRNEIIRGKIINNNCGDNNIKLSGGVYVSLMQGTLFANNRFGQMLEAGVLYNNTIINNKSDFLFCKVMTMSPFWKNNIFWGNKNDSFNGKLFYLSSNENVYVYNNLIQGDSLAFIDSFKIGSKKPKVYQGNISQAPKFIKPTLGIGPNFDASVADFRLALNCDSISPGINVGHLDTWGMYTGYKDLTGNRRFYDGRIDLGAYEDNSGPVKPKILKDIEPDSLCLNSGNGLLNINAYGFGVTKQWQTNAPGSWVNISGKTNDSLMISNPKVSDNQVKYRVIVKGSCASDTSNERGVWVHQLPIVNLGKDTSLCYGNNLKVTASLTGNYLWQDGSKTDSLKQTIIKDTIWTLRLVDKYGCSGSDTLKVYALPLPQFSLGPDINLHRLKSIVLDPGNFKSYLWNDASTARTKTFFGQDLGANGDYPFWVRVTDVNGCSATDSINVKVFMNSAVQSLYSQGLSIYPNPSKDIIHITNKDNQSFNWEVYNSGGQKILSGDESTAINLTEVLQGIYFIRIQSKDIDETVRVSKVDN